MKFTREKVQASVVKLLEDMTKDWDLDLEEISDETLLGQDLGLGSMDTLHLMASINMELGVQYHYEDLVTENGAYVADLSTGQLIDFLLQQQDAPTLGPQKM